MIQKGFSVILLVLIVFVVSALGFFGLQIFKKNSLVKNILTTEVKKVSRDSNPFNEKYSQGKCEGEKGTVTFTHSPMNIEDIGEILPYGIMIDGHVIPTSHGYFYPAEFNSARDKYPVYAIADGVIVSVSHRGAFIGEAKNLFIGDNPGDRKLN